MNLRVQSNPCPFPSDFQMRDEVVHTVSCEKDVHVYVAVIFRGEDMIWNKSEVFRGRVLELFRLRWDLAQVQAGDEYRVVGYRPGPENNLNGYRPP